MARPDRRIRFGVDGRGGTNDCGWSARHAANSLSLASTVSITALTTYDGSSPMNAAYAHKVSWFSWSNRVRHWTKALPRVRGLMMDMTTPSHGGVLPTPLLPRRHSQRRPSV